MYLFGKCFAQWVVGILHTPPISRRVWLYLKRLSIWLIVGRRFTVARQHQLLTDFLNKLFRLTTATKRHNKNHPHERMVVCAYEISLKGRRRNRLASPLKSTWVLCTTIGAGLLAFASSVNEPSRFKGSGCVSLLSAITVAGQRRLWTELPY